MEVLSGRTPPLVMIMRGKLRLKKGSITRLLPFTQSAQELIRSAQMIS
jgi:putative sterol carrier protein